MLRLCSKHVCIFVLCIGLIIIAVWLVMTRNEESNNICQADNDWIRSLHLDDDVILRWKIEDKEIVMMVEGRTSGWIGIGLSTEPTLKGADFVRGWISNDMVFLEDRHFVSDNEAEMDQERDYILVGSQKNTTHTTICFKRKLDTCDENDVRLKTASIPVIWTTSSDIPTQDLFSKKIQIDTTKVKTKLIDFLNKRYPEDNSPEVLSMDFRVTEFTLPTDKESIYWCQIFPIPKVKGKPQLIGFEPILSSNEHIIHHILLQACVKAEDKKPIPDGEECFTNGKEIEWADCSKFVTVWTSGTPLGKEFIPPNVGYDFDASTEEKTKYLQVIIHYYNPENKTGVRDSSGMRLYLTTKRREFVGGIFMITHSTNTHQIIPPKQQEFPTVSFCHKTCFQETIPPEGIHLFALRPHAHLLGRKLILRHFRDGVELEPISSDHFSYEDEHTIYLQEDRLILPNDKLDFDCYYDSTNRTDTTFGGAATRAEMCQTYLMYYPIINLHMCQTSLSLAPALNVIGAASWPEKSSKIRIPESANNISVKNYLKTYKWRKEEVEQLRNLYLNGEFRTYCIWNNGSSHINEKQNHTHLEKAFSNTICN